MEVIFDWEAIKNIWEVGRVPYMCGLFQLIPLFLLTDPAGDQTLLSTVQTTTAILALHCWGFVLIEICFLHLVIDQVQHCLICHLKK